LKGEYGMNIPLPKEIVPAVPWLEKLESMVGETTKEVEVIKTENPRPELHPIHTYTMTREEIDAYFMKKYGGIPQPQGKKPISHWR
jgi:hypothetical protein